MGCQTLFLIAPPKTLLIAPPLIIPHLKIPKTLLIKAPQNNVSIFFHKYDKGLRCMVLHLINPNLDDHVDLLKGIFNAVTTYQPFIEFATYKSIIVSAVMFDEMSDITFSGSNEYNFHHNVLIEANTTFNQYYKQVGEFVNHKLEQGYGHEVIHYYKVRVWNLDNMKNAKIKLQNKGRIEHLGYRSYSTLTNNTTNKNIIPSKININPIKADKEKFSFATMDIETMNIGGNKIPVAITTCNSKSSGIFVIDHILLKTNLELAVSNLWNQYFNHINNVGDELIFAHNLGSFDGYFLFKALIPAFTQDLIETVNISNNNLTNYLTTRIVKEVLEINDNYSTLLLASNINLNVLRDLNMICDSHIKNVTKFVMSNVAGAAHQSSGAPA